MSARKSSAPNESLAAQAIQQQCKLLRLPTVGAQFETLAKQAIRERQTPVGYLEALLSAELEERERRTVDRRLREARLRVAVVTDLLSQNLPRAANRQRTLERLASSR